MSSVIPVEYLDDSELTPDEQDLWGDRLHSSLCEQYSARIEALYCTGEYDVTTPEQWRAMLDRAWQETFETNEVCREITAITLERRARKAELEPLREDAGNAW